MKPCNSKHHDPPRMALEKGTHTYRCPLCGNETTFTTSSTEHKEVVGEIFKRRGGYKKKKKKLDK